MRRRGPPGPWHTIGRPTCTSLAGYPKLTESRAAGGWSARAPCWDRAWKCAETASMSEWQYGWRTGCRPGGQSVLAASPSWGSRPHFRLCTECTVRWQCGLLRCLVTVFVGCTYWRQYMLRIGLHRYVRTDSCVRSVQHTDTWQLSVWPCKAKHSKVKSSPYTGHQGPRGGSRGIALLFHDLGARRGWVVSTTPRPLYPRERPGIHCTGGWVGPRAGLDVCEKSHPHRDSIPGPSNS
jgi:hypothetical protein